MEQEDQIFDAKLEDYNKISPINRLWSNKLFRTFEVFGEYPDKISFVIVVPRKTSRNQCRTMVPEIA